MAQLSVISLPGKAVKEITSLLAAATASDKFQNDGETYLLIDGGSAPTGTVTVESAPCSHGRSNEDISQVVAAGTQYLIGPLSPGQYNDANGDVVVTSTNQTDIKYAAVKF